MAERITLQQEKRSGYNPGRPYRTAEASSPEEYLQIVLRSEKFISRYAVETPEGLYWKKPGISWRGDLADIDLSLKTVRPAGPWLSGG